MLAREQHLSQLDGLAAGGGPRTRHADRHHHGGGQGTRPPARNPSANTSVAEDLALLRDQVERCRGILAKLTSLDADQGGFIETITLSHLVEELVAPQRALGIILDVTTKGEGPEPACRRNPGVMFGLGNIVDNAIDFAESCVSIEARLERRPGRARDPRRRTGLRPEVRRWVGEPYVSIPQRGGGRHRRGNGLASACSSPRP